MCQDLGNRLGALDTAKGIQSSDCGVHSWIFQAGPALRGLTTIGSKSTVTAEQRQEKVFEAAELALYRLGAQPAHYNRTQAYRTSFNQHTQAGGSA